MPAKRILLITDNHSATGGAENYFFNLKHHLQQQADIEVFSLGFADEASSGKDFFVLPRTQSNLKKLLGRFWVNPVIYWKLSQKVREIKPDVIHLHNIKQYTASILRAIKPYPVIQTVHDFSLICPTGQNLHTDMHVCASGFSWQCFFRHQIKYSFFSFLLLTLSFLKIRFQVKQVVKQFIAPSPLLTEYLNKNKFPAIYIPHFTLSKKDYDFSQIKRKHFLFAGNLGAHKGVFILIKEFALACQKDPKLFLTIAGTGPEKKAMRLLAEKLGITNNLEFLDWQENLAPYYLQACALLFPSIGLEAFGLVITEAMSYARPVIASRRGPSEWLVLDKQSGLLFDPLKPGDLSEQILLLADNLELVKEMGKNGFERLQMFPSNEEILAKLMDVYSVE